MSRLNMISCTLALTVYFSGGFTEAATEPVQKQSLKVNRKTRTQEVNFSEMSLSGTIRKPDGAYLVQKRGLRFQPLYKIQEDFDRKIRESFLYID